jgi:glycosyltransferase involved in cell wall biosynthesis
MRNNPRVSVAIPVYNEAEVLPHLLQRLRSVLESLPGGPHEIVFVDDGSSDGSLGYLESEAARDPRIVVIALSRNFGHQIAVSAALDQVVGEVTVVMDSDLQDEPEGIPLLLAESAKGYDVVFARRGSRKEGLFLRLSYRVFYRLIAWLSAIDLPLDAGDFGLISRRVVEQIRRSPEHHRYLRGLRRWVGFRQTGIVLDRPARHSGRSKYGLFKLVQLASDGIFAFSTVPLRAAAALGGAAVGVSVLFALYTLYAKLVLEQAPRGFTALVLIITFLSGLNLLFLGVLGEYLGRVYEEVKGRPLYIIDRIIRNSGPKVEDAPVATSDAGMHSGPADAV